MDFSDPTRIFGWIAVSLSLTYKFPQIYKLYRTNDTRGLSVFSQIIQASAYFFYIVHGTIIEDPPVVFLGCTSMAQSAVLIGQFYYYTRYKAVGDHRTVHTDYLGDLEAVKHNDTALDADKQGIS